LFYFNAIEVIPDVNFDSVEEFNTDILKHFDKEQAKLS